MGRVRGRVRTLLLALSLVLVSTGAVGAAPRSPVGDQLSSCRQLELDDPLPVGVAVPCPGIRPGAFVQVDGQGGCTASFLFRGTVRGDGTTADEALYVLTAGHCALDEERQGVWAAGGGPAARDAAGQRIGEVVAAVSHGLDDVALIRIDAEREDDVDPSMCHFGGPTALATERTEVGTVVRHFGNGVFVGRLASGQPTAPGRSGIVANANDGDLQFAGAAKPGDSGSPVMAADGTALGVLVGGLGATVTAFSLEAQLRALADVVDVELELLTAPLAS